ncbi:MAG: cephalosporin hydroxylase family protein [Rhodopila sp.]|jgi:cephalosporin hydroxylase
MDIAFENDCANQIAAQGADEDLAEQSITWLVGTAKFKYSYHFKFAGLPIIQYPGDIVMMQELIWSIRPDFIVETGIARGGSIVLNAAMLALLDYCECAAAGQVLDPARPRRRVIGIDIDIREPNRRAIEAHPLTNRIDLIQGSSIDPDVVRQVWQRTDSASRDSRVLVCLDSNHTHDHVLAELEAYAPLVSPGSYCVVMDTVIEDMPPGSFPDRPWDKGDNPKTAVRAFLRRHPEFEIDTAIPHKLLVTVAPDGYLKRKHS